MSMRTMLLGLAALAAAALPSVAEDFVAGSLTIARPWARASIGEAANSAAYMTIANSGDSADRLAAVGTEVAGDTMLHESRMDGGVMKMVHLADGVAIPAHGTAELKPLGLHVMLIGLKRPLKAGETFPMTLVFEHQGEVAITVRVGEPPAGEQPHK